MKRNMKKLTLLGTLVVLGTVALVLSAMALSSRSAQAADHYVGTPGFWSNHPEAWPVGGLDIGDEYYMKAEAIDLMQHPTSGDMTLAMYRQLVAAHLNVYSGADSSCIMYEIDAADEWFTVWPPYSGVTANSPAWEEGEPYKDLLDAYNNGELCAVPVPDED